MLINQMKTQIVSNMIIQLRDIEGLANALTSLDETAHSGSYDLNDQLTTITKHINGLEDVLHRAQMIIPK